MSLLSCYGLFCIHTHSCLLYSKPLESLPGVLGTGKGISNTGSCVIPRDIVFVFFILSNIWIAFPVSCLPLKGNFQQLQSYTDWFRARICVSLCPPGAVQETWLLLNSALNSASCLSCLYFGFVFKLKVIGLDFFF